MNYGKGSVLFPCPALLRRATRGGYGRGMLNSFRSSSGARFAALLGIACIGLAAAGCSSSSSSSSSSASASTSAAPTGTANVAYASSLTYLNENVVKPAFTATGYGFSGTGNASGTLESDIAAGEISPNVFESVGGDNITPLQPKFTKWYVQYAGTSMVIAYNPKSKYASEFKAYADGSKPLSTLFSSLLQTPGLKLGRTDPNIDPQGRDFIYMLELAQSYYHLPSDTVAKILGTTDFGTSNSSQIYAESALDSTLQSGQLDASSAFVTHAIELHLDYIPLPVQINLCCSQYASVYKTATVKLADGTTKSGSPQVIDVTIIGKPTDAGVAFVKYTLSPAGLALYKAGGFTVLTPTIIGSTSSVPAAISSELGG